MQTSSEKHVHECPNCGSQKVRRSTRHGLKENIVYRVMGVGPYRCTTCDERFVDRNTGKKKAKPEEEQEN
jgi:predicted RNA-binding Zn-ribbon protein involved in translation (DUF1610 family)